MRPISDLCVTSLNILKDYYSFDSNFEVDFINDFILPELQHENDSKVLFQETENDFFIGIQFEKEIFDEIKYLKQNEYNQKTKYISLNTASVIAEEISHFKLILDVLQNNKKISQLNLEIIGEIDKFLCLMHWNHKNDIRIQHNWKNIHDICDFLFRGNRFKIRDDYQLYIDSESHAFLHLKQAFKNEWDYTWFNFSKINFFAANYLKKLRTNFQIDD